MVLGCWLPVSGGEQWTISFQFVFVDADVCRLMPFTLLHHNALYFSSLRIWCIGIILHFTIPFMQIFWGPSPKDWAPKMSTVISPYFGRNYGFLPRQAKGILRIWWTIFIFWLIFCHWNTIQVREITKCTYSYDIKMNTS